MQTTDGRDVTCTVTKEGDAKWIIVQKNKKAGGPDVRVTREDIQYEFWTFGNFFWDFIISWQYA